METKLRDALVEALLCAHEADRPLSDIEAEGFPVMTRYGFKITELGPGQRNVYQQVIDFVAKKRVIALAMAGAV